MSEVVLYVPFEMKNRVKNSGCKWNADIKCWMATEELVSRFPYLEKYVGVPEKVYYTVPFKRKNEFKSGGKNRKKATNQIYRRPFF